MSSQSTIPRVSIVIAPGELRSLCLQTCSGSGIALALVGRNEDGIHATHRFQLPVDRLKLAPERLSDEAPGYLLEAALARVRSLQVRGLSLFAVNRH
jgi:hypothetical protein